MAESDHSVAVLKKSVGPKNVWPSDPVGFWKVR
jgi:hypothetical protein